MKVLSRVSNRLMNGESDEDPRWMDMRDVLDKYGKRLDSKNSTGFTIDSTMTTFSSKETEEEEDYSDVVNL